MAYKQYLKRAIDLLVESGSDDSVITELKELMNYASAKTNEVVVNNFIEVTKKYNLCKWINIIGIKGKFQSRNGDVLAKTKEEEICYRRGFVQGAQALIEYLKLADTRAQKYVDELHTWRLDSFFEIMDCQKQSRDSGIYDKLETYLKS